MCVIYDDLMREYVITEAIKLTFISVNAVPNDVTKLGQSGLDLFDAGFHAMHWLSVIFGHISPGFEEEEISCNQSLF